jgi:hypothetical protein
MRQLYSLNIDQYLEIVELAQKNGKKPGDSMQEEFEIVAKKYNLQSIGQTDKDIDQLTGDLREEGAKVLNIKELERRKQNEDK